jgi:hypothetical protein
MLNEAKLVEELGEAICRATEAGDEQTARMLADLQGRIKVLLCREGAAGIPRPRQRAYGSNPLRARTGPQSRRVRRSLGAD